MSYAIVAIPAEDDYVWKISSEKIPHLTLLYLGDHLNNVDEVVRYIEHVAKNTMYRFGLDVSRRGKLGDKDADVLFFDKRIASKIEEIRSYFLKNDDIARSYADAMTYDTWVPHLTLGWPNTPAHEDARDYPGVQWVFFDKVALWTGNYTGPEFELTNEDKYTTSPGDLMMSSVGKQLVSALSEPKTIARVSNRSWSSFKPSDYTIEEWRRACLIHPSEPSESKGDYKLPVKEPDGTLNKNGVFAAAAYLSGARGGVKATDAQKKSAAKKLIGFYASIDATPPDGIKELSHSYAEDFLEHFGVKGMKWGVRRFGRRGRTKADVRSDDSKATDTSKATLQKHGTKALSTAELQRLVTRMNLEQQYASLKAKEPTKVSSGHAAVKSVLGVAKTGVDVYNTLNSPAGKEALRLGKALLRHR